jgi:2-polyprenyl-6-methoxyphenol hydroxylase-like FAD-dependent oxidoreductase
MNQNQYYDVIIIGASVGGSSAAILYAQRGLRVALVERNSDIDAYKKVCTHHIQPFAVPVLKKMGIFEKLTAAGGQSNASRIWTRYGWFGPGAKSKSQGINIRRSVLDPMLRRQAAALPKVDLMLGTSLQELVREDGRITGVKVRTATRETKTLYAKLVVGADGRYSRTATLADLPTRSEENNRFIYFAYFRNLPLTDEAQTLVWYLNPDIAYAMANDDGLTLMAVMVHKNKLDTFKKDIEGNFRKMLHQLPDGPDFANAEQASEVIGMLNMPNISRSPAAPGLALIGDATLAADPVWGNGMAWAFNSARWLVDRTAHSLMTGTAQDIDAALETYKEHHQNRLGPRFEREVDFANGRRFNLIEQLMQAASVKDKRFWSYAAPTIMNWRKREQLPSRELIRDALQVVTGLDQWSHGWHAWQNRWTRLWHHSSETAIHSKPTN